MFGLSFVVGNNRNIENREFDYTRHYFITFRKHGTMFCRVRTGKVFLSRAAVAAAAAAAVCIVRSRASM